MKIGKKSLAASAQNRVNEKSPCKKSLEEDEIWPCHAHRRIKTRPWRVLNEETRGKSSMQETKSVRTGAGHLAV
jgi:hypothetical protein